MTSIWKNIGFENECIVSINKLGLFLIRAVFGNTAKEVDGSDENVKRLFKEEELKSN